MTAVFDSTLTYDDLYSYAGGGPAIAHSIVELAGIWFSAAADDDGIEWIVEKLEGWDSPDVRSGSSPRPQDDGVFAPAFRHGGRELELTGHLLAPSIEAAFAAKNDLAGAVNLREPLLLVVHEDVSRQASVVRSGRLLIEQRSRHVRFQLPLLAVDPRRYSTTEDTLTVAPGATGTATNAGDVATRPTAIISGPVDTPTLTNETTGEELSFDLVLAAGEELEVDFDLRTATVDGVTARPYLVAGYRWWELAPGDTTVALDAVSSSGTAGLELRWRSAWI